VVARTGKWHRLKSIREGDTNREFWHLEELDAFGNGGATHPTQP
jgi:hypothetical protein